MHVCARAPFVVTNSPSTARSLRQSLTVITGKLARIIEFLTTGVVE